MAYLPHKREEREAMLQTIGVKGIDELFSDIPEALRVKGELGIGAPMNEMELRSKLLKLSRKNQDVTELACFMGAGYYDHYIPAITNAIVSREEFLTAYTPYQAEMSQGFLQAIFEYQTMICNLTGMAVSNASMYDGATAIVEASVMAVNALKKREKILLFGTLSTENLCVAKSYFSKMEIEFEILKSESDVVDLNQLKEKLDASVAGVVMQFPNFYGSLEDIEEISRLVHENGSLLIVSTYPIALGLLKSPGEFGADIVVGEGQSLGLELSFGGPTFGFLATKIEYVRLMPGRIVGESVDSKGKKAYTLTLQAREQHIKRHRALSNICSNQSLCMLKASIYMSFMGADGLEAVAYNSFQKAHFLEENLSKISGIKVFNTAEFFNEFVIEIEGGVDRVVEMLEGVGILGGVKLSDTRFLVAVTEKRTLEELKLYCDTVRGLS
ncbi:MAG: aminomethyl-transferring glycine dehydrogenase subunit GcvPA [Fusobacteria bacterium]|nr:aminomethyl-transferring glycine dehydrogenase subunit GcvPA [Fusobacteriota bacterium]